MTHAQAHFRKTMSEFKIIILRDSYTNFVFRTFLLYQTRFYIIFIIFYRRYGTKCSGCGLGIAPTDLVRKTRDKVFHLNCFTCFSCNRQLSTGEHLYVVDDNKFLCKEDYLRKQSQQSILTGKSLFLFLKQSKYKNPDAPL